jgi:hypothetical protein
LVGSVVAIGGTVAGCGLSGLMYIPFNVATGELEFPTWKSFSRFGCLNFITFSFNVFIPNFIKGKIIGFKGTEDLSLN